jgi:hypothetical protein
MIPARAALDRATTRKTSPGVGDHRRAHCMHFRKHLRHDPVAALGGQLENVEAFRTQATCNIHFQSLLRAVQPSAHRRLVQSEADSNFHSAQVFHDAQHEHGAENFRQCIDRGFELLPAGSGVSAFNARWDLRGGGRRCGRRAR